MSDEIWSRGEIDSPCTKVCVIDPSTRLCIGCRRTMDEIADWSRMTPDRRRQIMQTLAERAVPAGRRGGRARRTSG